MAPSSKYKHYVKASMVAVDAASLCCAIALIALALMSSAGDGVREEAVRGQQLVDRRPCDEIYVVREDETLHTISDKCGDPYIVERNPHIHDPDDDVFPGLVIKIVPECDLYQ